MAGRPDEYSRRRTKEIKGRIEAFFSRNATPIEPSSPRMDQLAEALGQDPTVSDPEPERMTRKEIKGVLNQLRSQESSDGFRKKLWKVHGLNEELESLVNAKVMLQGAEVRCPHCFTTEWRVVDDLSSEMRCNGCLFRFPMPLTPEWSFRLNDLVRNALKKQGTLAVLHALYELKGRLSNNPLLFMPCQDIFEHDQTEPFTDLDIVAIRNCRVIIGEVKSSPGGFGSSDFDKLKQVAEDLAPDVVLIAAPGEGWPSDVMAAIRRLRDALSSQGIEVKELLLDRSL